MGRVLKVVAVSFAVLCIAASALAQGGATKEDAVAKVKEAAALVKSKGVDAAIEVVNDPNGPFVFKDTYVFFLNLDGKVLAHPTNPKLIGKTPASADVNGKMFSAEFISVAKNQGEGWVDYMWPKPGEQAPSRKVTYVYKVPETDVVVLCGIYE